MRTVPIAFRCTGIALLFLVQAQAATAQELCATTDTLSVRCQASRTDSVTNHRFQIGATPYVWALGIFGAIGVMGNRFDVHVTARDIVDHLQAGFMGALEGTYRRWSMEIDVTYLKVEDLFIVPPPPVPPGTRANAVAKQAVFEFQAGYQVSHTAPLAVDALVGGRRWVLDNAVTLSSDAQPTTTLTLNESWTEPFVGARASIDLSPRLLLQLHGDVGGFGVGSRSSWQALGTLRYRISSRWTARVGFRDVGIDFKDDNKDFFYDVDYRGPIVSVTYRF